MPSANLDLIRAINQFHILNTVRAKGTVSRSEIADITGQSRASVTTITAKMIEKDLIFEKKTENTGERGRNRVLLALNPEAAFVAGVKLSASQISCAVCDMTGNTRSSIFTPMRLRKKNVEFITDLIGDIVHHTVNEAGLALSSISGVGIGIPGVVDIRTETCHWSPLYDAGDIPLRDRLQKHLNIKTYIGNDANTLALAHQWFGEGKGVDNFLVVTLEDGVGMGVILNGQLYRGTRGFAGEFGHLVIDPEGDECICGNRGCLQTFLGGFAIINKAEKLVEKGLWKRQTDTDMTFKEIIIAAKDGEKELSEIFHRAGHFLGVGLSSLINIFNPEKIILAGKSIEAGDLMFKPMYAAIKKHAFGDMLELTQIVIPEWQYTDWAAGAASLVLQELYKSPFNTIRPVI